MAETEFPDVIEIYYGRRMLEHLCGWRDSVCALRSQRNYVSSRRERSLVDLKRNALQELHRLRMGLAPSPSGDSACGDSPNGVEDADQSQTVAHELLEIDDDQSDLTFLSCVSDSESSEPEIMQFIPVEIFMELVTALLEGWRLFVEVDVLTPSSMPIMIFENQGQDEAFKVVDVDQDVAKKFLDVWNAEVRYPVQRVRKKVLFYCLKRCCTEQCKEHIESGAPVLPRQAFSNWFQWTSWKIFSFHAKHHMQDHSSFYSTKSAFHKWFSKLSRRPADHIGADMLVRAVNKVKSSSVLLTWKVKTMTGQIHAAAYNFLAIWTERLVSHNYFRLWISFVVLARADFIYFQSIGYKFFFPWIDHMNRSLLQTVARFRRVLISEQVMLDSNFNFKRRVMQDLKHYVISELYFDEVLTCSLGRFFRRWKSKVDDTSYYVDCCDRLYLLMDKNRCSLALSGWYKYMESTRQTKCAEIEYYEIICQHRLENILQFWRTWCARRKNLAYILCESCKTTPKGTECDEMKVHIQAKVFAQTRMMRGDVSAWRHVTMWRMHCTKIALLFYRRRCNLIKMRVMLSWSLKSDCSAQLFDFHFEIVRKSTSNRKSRALRAMHKFCSHKKFLATRNASVSQTTRYRLLQKRFLPWSALVRRKNDIMDAEHILCLQVRVSILRQNLNAWRFFAVFKFTWESKCKVHRAAFALKCWRSASANEMKIQNCVEQILSKTRTSRSSFILATWNNLSRSKKTELNIIHRLSFKVITRKAVCDWKKFLDVKYKLKDNDIIAQTFATKKLAVKCFRSLQVHLHYISRKENAVEVSEGRILCKIWKGWHEVSMTRIELQSLIQDYNFRMVSRAIKNSFRRWKAGHRKSLSLNNVVAQVKGLSNRCVARRCFQVMRDLTRARSKCNSYQLSQALEMWRGTLIRRQLRFMRGIARMLQFIEVDLARHECKLRDGMTFWSVCADAKYRKEKLFALFARKNETRIIFKVLIVWREHMILCQDLEVLIGNFQSRLRQSAFVAHFQEWRVWTHIWSNAVDQQTLMDKKILITSISFWRSYADQGRKSNSARLCVASNRNGSQKRQYLEMWLEYTRLRKLRVNLNMKSEKYYLERSYSVFWTRWLKAAPVSAFEACVRTRSLREHFAQWALRLWNQLKVQNMRSKAQSLSCLNWLRSWHHATRHLVFLGSVYTYFAKRRRLGKLSRILGQWQPAVRFESALRRAGETFWYSVQGRKTRHALSYWNSHSKLSIVTRKCLSLNKQKQDSHLMLTIIEQFLLVAKSSRRYRLKIENHVFARWKALAGMQLFWKSTVHRMAGIYIRWFFSRMLEEWSKRQRANQHLRMRLKALGYAARLCGACLAVWHSHASTLASLHRRGVAYVVKRNRGRVVASLGLWIAMLDGVRALQIQRASRLCDAMGAARVDREGPPPGGAGGAELSASSPARCDGAAAPAAAKAAAMAAARRGPPGPAFAYQRSRYYGDLQYRE